ncbi:MAG: endonuclease/exonuclease/phosphatase family protein [Prevotella sp.]|nr:endonuclease/exonuclease/phosphatase family protein [Prevotella sp.]
MKTNRLLITLLLVAMTVQVALADEIKIVGQNVQNFFYSLDRGRTQGNGVPISNYDDEAGRTAKLNAIVNTLSVYNADVYAFNEVECCAESLELLAQGMSSKTGKSYIPVADGLTYDKEKEADGVIKSGFIYNSATIEPLGNNVSTAIGYNYVYPYQMRMQAFKSKASGESFTLSMNHFKASTSGDFDADAKTREQNCIALMKGLDQATLDPDILVMGDLNSQMGEECLNTLLNVGFEEQIVKRDPYAASHWYYEEGSLIDHVFANGTMAAQVTDAHIEYVANPHSTGSKNSAYSDHDPYMVTLNLQAQPAPSYCYKKAVAVTAGNNYLMVANDQKMANPVPTDKSYADMLATDITVTNDMVVRDDAKNAFCLEDAGGGSYYIKDYYGRFLSNGYNTSSSKYYNTVNVGDKSTAHTYTITPQSDGTFKILNTVSNYYFLYHTSWGKYTCQNWASLYSGQYLPALLEYDPNATPTAISTMNVYSQPTITRKVMENGRLVIMTPDGKRYTLQGIEQR